MSSNEVLKVGDFESLTKTLSETDVYLFAGITNDFNPVHINSVAAEKSIFKKRVVHGALTSSLVSAVLGTKLPGEGTVYLKQTSEFLKPVYLNDTVTAIVEVKEIREAKKIVRLRTYCINQNSEVVLEGEAVVMAPKNRIKEAR